MNMSELGCMGFFKIFRIWEPEMKLQKGLRTTLVNYEGSVLELHHS